MTEKNEQQRGREEDLMARGPVSAGASNKSAPMNQGQQPGQPVPPESERETSTQENADYNKMIVDRSSGTTTGSGMETDRDLGTVGGGTVPNTGGAPRTGRNTSSSTVAGGGTSAGGLTGAGATRDRGSMSDAEMDTSTNTENMINRQSQGNIGGRNPGQPPTATGDRDATHGGRGKGANEETTDPMTSRAPEQANRDYAARKKAEAEQEAKAKQQAEARKKEKGKAEKH